MIQIHRNNRQMHNFDILASLCNMADWFLSDLVSNLRTGFLETRSTSHVARKSVFGISDQVRLKTVCLATETS